MTVVAVAAAVLALAMGQWSAPVRSQLQQPPTTHRQPQPQSQQQSAGTDAPEKASTTPSGFDDQLIERIRKHLALAQDLLIVQSKPDVPVYRVEIFGYRFQPPDWRERMPAPSPVPQPFGGADYYEMMRLITPPEFWGSSWMSNREVLDLLLTATETWAGRLAVKKAVKAYRSGTTNRARTNVQREIAEIAAHNARVAAAKGEAAAKPPADKKKQEEKKKQAEVKKK